MNGPLLTVAVVGHTNTGKTSLMRTLMRDVEFGEVSDRPAVTREVQAAVLRAGGEPAISLFDTPGLEDSIGLLEHLDDLRGERRIDGIDIINEFLAGEEAQGRFLQEAKAIRQVLDSDVAIYVVDVRDRVHGKHRDELEILGRCAKPVVPVLNFTADENAETPRWREQLSRVNMHAVVEFDTVVFNESDERRLFEKIGTLLDDHRERLDALIVERTELRKEILGSSAMLLAELMIDVAAYAVSVPVDDTERAERAMEEMKRAIREREQQAVDQLLKLHRFRPGDLEDSALLIEGGEWGFDLFSPEAMRQFGFKAGGAAAAGAMVGLTLDIMLGGLSLGAGTLTGAAIGGAVGALRSHGKRMFDRLRGMTELRCNDGTLQLLAAREVALIRALIRRGHASMQAIRLNEQDRKQESEALPSRAMQILGRARGNPRFSNLPAARSTGSSSSDPARHEALFELAETIREAI